jgi:copper resistance protein B
MTDMPGMAMPPTAPVSASNEHDMSSMPGMDMPKPDAPVAADPHAGHDMSGVAGMRGMGSVDSEIGNTPAPAPPTDHAADAVFGADQMADSRKMLRHENGGMPAYSILFNLAEYRVQKGADAYRWDGEGWFGGDIDRLVVKTEGEGAVRGGVESAEVQALYSRAIDPWFNLQAGVRHDFKPGPARTYATIGFEGIAPYWFEVEGALFLSDKGDLLGRLEGYYDQRITQHLILQPRVELNFAAQDVPANGIGSGLSDAELGLRLRYEIKREFAPYVGISWENKVGGSARFARAVGDKVQATSIVFGIRAWF